MMPFTLSHPAAVGLIWPVARRAHVPLSALAIGAMSPDFEFFLHLSPRALLSHTVPGLVLFCLPAGLICFAIWELLVQDVVRELVALPARTAEGERSVRWWMLAGVGILIGAASHLIWDGLTHGGYWGAALWPWLLEPAFAIGTLQVPWFNALQHLSTIVGGLIVLAWAFAQVRRDGDLTLMLRTPWRRQAIATIVVSAILAGMANGSRGPFGADFWTAQRLLGRIAVGALLGLGVGLVIVAQRHRREAARP
jgi:hypothetical protein